MWVMTRAKARAPGTYLSFATPNDTLRANESWDSSPFSAASSQAAAPARLRLALLSASLEHFPLLLGCQILRHEPAPLPCHVSRCTHNRINAMSNKPLLGVVGYPAPIVLESSRHWQANEQMGAT